MAVPLNRSIMIATSGPGACHTPDQTLPTERSALGAPRHPIIVALVGGHADGLVIQCGASASRACDARSITAPNSLRIYPRFLRLLDAYRTAYATSNSFRVALQTRSISAPAGER